MPGPHSVKRRFSSLISASSHPLPQTPFRFSVGTTTKHHADQTATNPRVCLTNPWTTCEETGSQEVWQKMQTWRFQYGSKFPRARKIRKPEPPYLGHRDRGGQNVPNARGGGNSPRKLPLENLDFLTPKLAIFYRISIEKGQIQGPENSKISPPL